MLKLGIIVFDCNEILLSLGLVGRTLGEQGSFSPTVPIRRSKC